MSPSESGLLMVQKLGKDSRTIFLRWQLEKKRWVERGHPRHPRSLQQISLLPPLLFSVGASHLIIPNPFSTSASAVPTTPIASLMPTFVVRRRARQ